MKKTFISVISIALAASAYAIPNTFSEGDVISAEQMNENFQALEQQFQGSRAIIVNCAANETIGDAISNGYTNITVSGICTENLQFSMWREDSSENKTPTGKLAPRFLKIAGADSSAKIVDTSSNTESTVSVNSGATLFMENITVSGGQYGINAQRNSNLYLSGVSVENFTEKGIRVADSAWLGIDEDGATIVGTENSTGIELVTGASGWISSVTISGVDRGLNLYGGSMVYLNNYQISAVSRGITVDNSRVLKSRDGSASIEGTSDRAVSVSHGVFTNWEGTLEIKNLSGGKGLDFWMSQGNISNLKMPDFDNTGSGWKPALSINGGSSVNINGAEISGSTDGLLVSISDGSITNIENSTLTVGNAGGGIEAYGSSRLKLHNSTISGSVTDNLVNIDQGSTAQIRNSSSISGSVGGALVSTSHGSSSDIRDSTFTLNSGNRALAVKDSSNLEMWNSTLSGTATEQLVDVRRLSNAIIRNESKLSQSGSDTPDVRVSNLSFLSVWSDSSINSVDCHMKGTVSADEGTVTTLSSSCTE